MSVRKELQELSKMEQQKQQDMILVTGVFQNIERPGASVTFPFKKYREIPEKDYTLKHGETIEIPYMVAMHLRSLGTVLHTDAVDEAGRRVAGAGTQKLHRFSFHSMDFPQMIGR